MAADKKHWMADAFKNASGQLRKKTRTKAGHNISRSALKREANSSSGKTRKQANLAMVARRVNAKRGK